MLAKITRNSAEKHNLEGLHALYTTKQYVKAISCFSRALYANAREPSYYWHRAQAYLAISDFDSSILNIRLFLDACQNVEEEPKKPPVYVGKKMYSLVLFTWAQILLDQQRYKESLVFFQQVLELGEFTHTDIGVRLAIAHIGLGNLDDAQGHLFQLTNTEHVEYQDIEIYLLRARVYCLQDKIFYAAADVKIATQINPSHPALSSLTRKIMQAASTFKNQASEQIIRKDLNLAIWYLNQAIELDSENFKLLMLRGILLDRLGKDQEALEDLLEVYTWPSRDGDGEIELVKELGKLHGKLAMDAADFANDYAKALHHFQLSLNFTPNNPYNFRNRAAVHLEQGQDELALADLHKVCSLKEQDCHDIFFLDHRDDGKARAMTASDLECLHKDAHTKICSIFTRKARQDLASALKMSPVSKQATESQTALYKSCITCLSKALQHTLPHTITMRLSLLFERARCHFYLQALEEMKGDLEECLLIDPDHVDSKALLSLFEKTPLFIPAFPLQSFATDEKSKVLDGGTKDDLDKAADIPEQRESQLTLTGKKAIPSSRSTREERIQFQKKILEAFETVRIQL